MDTADVSEGDTCAVEGFIAGWIIDPPQDPLVHSVFSINALFYPSDALF